VKTNHPLVDDFRRVVTKNIPLIDLRAPVEYARGSFPDAANIPLLNDGEREAVGTTYKPEGSEAALKLGHEIVSGKAKEERIRSWIEYIEKHPETILFCWRGGRRSQIVQEWLAERGYAIPRLKGGFKAFRRWLSSESLAVAKKKKIFIIGGQTGSGKTLLIKNIDNAVDLEKIANHRGSAFGRHASPQPSQIDFENMLSYALIRHDNSGYTSLVIEDESRNIGQRYIPNELFEYFQNGKLLLLEAPLQERIEITYADYILYSQHEYSEALNRNKTPYSWIETMRHNFGRIRKRLGDERYRRALEMLESAWKEQTVSGNPEAHKEWISLLLREYYDPMYNYQIERKKERTVFRGNREEIMEYLQNH